MVPPVLAVGDVFLIPLDDERSGAGQVVGRYGDDAYYFALYYRTYPNTQRPEASAVLNDEIAILGLSMDARFSDGTWTVIGNQPVSDDVPLPAYRESVGAPDRVDIVDYSGKVRRRSSPSEANSLRTRKVVAPIRLERALRARAGLEPWLDAYAELEPDSYVTSRAVFKDQNEM